MFLSYKVTHYTEKSEKYTVDILYMCFFYSTLLSLNLYNIMIHINFIIKK